MKTFTLATLAILEAQALYLQHPHPEVLGMENCPCVEMTDIPPPVVVMAADGTTGEQVPNYGIRCGAHDMGNDPWCNGQAVPDPDFCGANWCYVEMDNCAAGDLVKSDLSPTHGYSYETCGSMGVEFVDPTAVAADSGMMDGAADGAAMDGAVDGAMDGSMSFDIIPNAADMGACMCLPVDGVVPTGDIDMITYQMDYGLGMCANHDEMTDACVMDPQPWCSQPWCYVADGCMASDVAASTTFTGRNYSYGQCGGVGGDGTVDVAAGDAMVDADGNLVTMDGAIIGVPDEAGTGLVDANGNPIEMDADGNMMGMDGAAADEDSGCGNVIDINVKMVVNMTSDG